MTNKATKYGLMTIAAVLLVTVAFAGAASADGENWGTYADTTWYNNQATEFTLTTPEQLAGLAELVNTNTDMFIGKTVKLGNDISLAGHDWVQIGVKTPARYVFKGVFDGQNYTISNLTIGSNSTKDVYGLFRSVSGSSKESPVVLRNLVLKDSVMEFNINKMCGTLVGAVGSNATISNCHVINSRINATSGSSVVGGLGGEFSSGENNVIDCSVTNCIINVTGGCYGGGLIGAKLNSASGIISGCVVNNFTIENNGNSKIGGFIGITQAGAIENCAIINCSIKSGSLTTGGFVGQIQSPSFCKNCLVVGTTVTTTTSSPAGYDGFGGFVGNLAGDVINCGVFTEKLIFPTEYGAVNNGRVSGQAGGAQTSNYAWDGMLINNDQVTCSSTSSVHGADVSSGILWNNQSFFQNTLGWDFENVWKMNNGNDKYRLPVLQWQTTPVLGDASYLIPSSSVVADANNVATFGYNNASIVRDTAVSSIVLERVNNVTGTVKFTVDNVSGIAVLPTISGMNAPITVSLFDITAVNDGSGTNSTIYLNVTFSNLTDKDNIKFFRYTDGSGWDATPLTSFIVNVNADEKKVLYKVETTSFSPFGIGIYTPITYTVHFDANGGVGSMDDMTFTYGEGQNLTANAFQRYNSNFLYWTCNGNKYYNTEFVKNLTTVDEDTVEMVAQWETYSTGGSSSGSTYMGSSSASYTPTQQPTVKPTVTPTAASTQAPATPTVIATEKPTTQATQQSPAPFVGLLAGLGAAAVLLRLRK